MGGKAGNFGRGDERGRRGKVTTPAASRLSPTWEGQPRLGRARLSKPLCHPTLAAPLPPSYEEGARRPGVVRFIGTVPTTHPLLPLPRRGDAKHRGGPEYVFRKHQLRSTGSNTPPPRRPFFRKRGRGNKDAALCAAFIKNCAAKRRKTF